MRALVFPGDDSAESEQHLCRALVEDSPNEPYGEHGPTEDVCRFHGAVCCTDQSMNDLRDSHFELRRERGTRPDRLTKLKCGVTPTASQAHCTTSPLQEVCVGDAHSMGLEQLLQLFGERCLPMMRLLSLHVAHDGGDAVAADGECTEAALPFEFRVQALVEPVCRGLLDLSDDGGRSDGWIEPPQEMNMVVVTADVNIGDAEVARRGRQKGVHSWANRGREGWTTTPRRKHDMKVNRCVSVHGVWPMRKVPVGLVPRIAIARLERPPSRPHFPV